MRFDYGAINNPFPIALSIGTLLKPKLKDIVNQENGMSFDKYYYFEALMKLEPETFYNKFKGEDGKKYWDSLTDEEQDSLTLYQVVINDENLLTDYLEMLNFFFKENVLFSDGYFILVDDNIENISDISSASDIHGAIHENTFADVLGAIQQICCISEKEKPVEEKRFKNKLAKRLFERMQKAAKEEQERKKSDINLTLPNIISAVSNKHPTVSPISVWELTVFQLLDSFDRLRVNSVFDIDSTRVSVWGDEKKTFDAALWYKNEYDRK